VNKGDEIKAQWDGCNWYQTDTNKRHITLYCCIVYIHTKRNRKRRVKRGRNEKGEKRRSERREARRKEQELQRFTCKSRIFSTHGNGHLLFADYTYACDNTWLCRLHVTTGTESG